MSDIEPIVPVGHVGAPEQARRHERSSADADKFKSEMLRKLAQVNESDPEQQKNRKHQAEEEEEEEEVVEPEPTPPSQVTPFELHKQVSPMEMGEKGKISPISSAQPTATPGPVTSSMATPAEGGDDDDEFWDEPSASIFTTSSQAQTQPPTTYQPTPQPSSETRPDLPSQPTISSQGPAQPTVQPQKQESTTEPSQQQQGQPQNQESLTPKPLQPASASKSGAEPPSGIDETVQSTPPGKEIGKPDQSELLEKGLTGEELSEIEKRPQEEATGALFQRIGQQEKSLSPQKKAEELEAEEKQISSAPTSKSKEGDTEGDRERKKKEEDHHLFSEDLGMPTPQIVIGGDVPVAPTAPPAYTSMSSLVLDLFERMVGVMTIISDSKMTETVITLNSPQFASSVFSGAQIIIQEYTSAPKAFNIQFNSDNPKAVALFQGNADDLMAAFQYGNYNFRVNRLETGHLGARPLFHRKENVSGDKQDQREAGA
jgi:hypothetical protein